MHNKTIRALSFGKHNVYRTTLVSLTGCQRGPAGPDGVAGERAGSVGEPSYHAAVVA